MKAYLINKGLIQKNKAIVFLLALMLITIPLKLAIGNIACMLFLLVCFLDYKNLKFQANISLFLPILFYLLMIISLSWTHDFKLTITGLQKEILFLLIPLAFLLIKKIPQQDVVYIIKIFSSSMVLYALYYFIKAIIKYFETGNNDVFFYHELVSLDLNAIYVSVFASFSLFYFIVHNNKLIVYKVAIFILSIFIFLLSSKGIIIIDFILIICYYIFFSETSKNIKFIIVTTICSVLLFSLIFVRQISERFLIEYQTAFVDNTINRANNSVVNVSISQAWSDKTFNSNNYFSGTALRVYQVRIFKEMLEEQNILFTGFGLNASQYKIREKEKEHNLYSGYGEFNFHNQYIQTFAEIGLLGLILLVAMLYINLKNALLNKNFLHIVFAITMISLFLTESFLCRQRGIAFFITLYCIFNVSTVQKLNLKS